MPVPIGEDFIKRTCYEFMGESDQYRGLPQPPLEMGFSQDSEKISLPDPRKLHTGKYDMRTVMEARQSRRNFRDIPLSLDELSLLLWFTQGVKEHFPEATLRNVPSAGARHPLETYLMINRVEGLVPGLYRFSAIENELEVLDIAENKGNELYRACLKQNFTRTCAVNFIWVAQIYRSSWRYGQRAYRYVFLDAGHACQNLYLAVPLVNCGVCAVAAFHDQSLARFLGIDGKTLFPVYMASVGKK
jgi:SagB-type dehydrogenase family enzyme